MVVIHILFLRSKLHNVDWNSISWFTASYVVIPALTGTMFFYQTQYLKVDSSLLGISKVFGQAAMLLWSVVYNRHLNTVPARKLIAIIQQQWQR